MSVYIVTGKLGNGKTLCSVGRIRDKLRAGCMVATNLDLDLVAMCGPWTQKPRVMRIPDKPTRADLDAIGCGNASYDETKNGLLVLDECGTWFNARNWADKARADVNGWFLHARKFGWDVILIVQDIALLDSQARDAIAELVVYCRRIDNITLPLVGPLYKLFTGSRFPLPRVHVARVNYGASHNALFYDRWVYRGSDLFACYDTRQAFLADYPHGAFSELTPWHRRGRYMVTRNMEFYMRMTKVYLRRFRVPVAAAAGVLVGVALAATVAFGQVYRDAQRDQTAAVKAAAVQLMLDNYEGRIAAEAEPTAQPGEPSLSPEAEALEELAGLNIVGWAKKAGRQAYYLARGGDDPVLLYSDDIAAAGMRVEAMGRCRVRVSQGATSQIITCL